ncbi:MAG TPA: Rieske 2Fe-2S domain-containing protein, partial [archaeon]|nr:Rieske 2Fe-2S domain-containing protein [archaeon]
TRVGGKLCAFANTCPHMSGPLGEGEVENGVVTCPLHGARFDVRSGANVGPTFGGEKVSPIRVFAAKAENGAVFVDV